MALELDRTRLESIVRAVVERLEGEWLLVGGALVALWLEPRRVTEDVDLVGVAGTAEERYRIMDLAADLGLPVEALNSAADFFVRRIADWREQIEIFRRGVRGVVYRPTPTLFVLLKLDRLSEIDLDDCRAVLARAQAEGLEVDRGRLLAALDGLPASEHRALAERRQTLRDLLRA